MTMNGEACADAIKKKIKNPKKYEWEVVVSHVNSAKISLSEGKLEEKQYSHDGGIGVRLIHNGRQGFSSANTLEPDMLATLWHEAESMLPFMQEDAFRQLPDPGKIISEDLETYDPAIAAMDLSGKDDLLLQMEQDVRHVDHRIKKTYRIEWDQGVGEMLVFNSRGMFFSRQGTSCYADVTCVAEEKGDTQVGSFSQHKRFLKDISCDEIPQTAGRLALDQLGGKPVPSGKIPVILEPWVVMEFLGMVASSVCADNVQKGKSLYKGKIGMPVAAGHVTIVDNPRVKRGLGSSAVDDEGIPTRRFNVIENGILKGFLYDSYTARKERTVSTGSGWRPSYRGMPEPGTSNFILLPGTVKRETMIRNTERGLRIISLMGMHTADPISGEFSVGAVGTLIEGGTYSRAVRGVTIAGNITDLMMHIDTICDDLMFIGSTGCPTVKIRDMMVGGS